MTNSVSQQSISPISFVLGEAVAEFKLLTRGAIIPVMFIGLVLYMWMIMLNADYMRQMGAVGIFRNSANMSYLMASGQSLWTMFAGAWLFSQGIARDKANQLSEVMLSAPVSLSHMILGRYLGALAVAVTLGCATFVGMATTPLLAMLGMIPVDAVGPNQWFSYFWAFLVYILPNAAGVGALYVVATIKTADSRGAFSIAAFLAFVWMVAMIVLRANDVDVYLASVIDPTGYSEAERQSDAWTPEEKQVGVLALTPQFLLNRLIWTVLPLLFMAVAVWRTTREHIILNTGKSEKNKSDDDGDTVTEKLPQKRGSRAAQAKDLITAPAQWFSAVFSECAWHLKLLVGGFGFRLAILMLILSGAMGTWVNFVQQPEGPLVAYPEAILPFLTEFFYLIIVFIMVGFLGVLVRRDDRPGYDEWLDCTPAPLGVPIVAKALAGFALVIILCAMPAVSSFLVTALNAPHALSFDLPFAFMFLTVLPSLLELAALIFFLHALIKPAGLAYSLSIFAGFIAIINHELSIVEYAPGQFAVPPHMHFSTLTGWSPWLDPMLTMGALKIVTALLLFALAWLAWRRGTALTTGTRFATFTGRLKGAPGALSAASVAAMVLIAISLNARFIDAGGYKSTAQDIADRANWEEAWWQKASEYEMAGGTVEVSISPSTRQGEILWRLNGLVGDAEYLHATMPHGVELVRASIAGVERRVERDEDHISIDVGECKQSSCDLVLELSVGFDDWPLEDPVWLYESGVWLRAADILPTLGHDRSHLVLGELDRVKNGLSPKVPGMPKTTALTSLESVAPAGNWRWQVTIVNEPGADSLLIGAEGASEGPLNFSTVWLPDATAVVNQSAGGHSLWFTPVRSELATAINQDISRLSDCVETRLGASLPEFATIQSPDHQGHIALHNNLLWLPEDEIWNAEPGGFGYSVVQYNLARAMAKRLVLDHLNIRDGYGARWLVEGVSGWVAFNCIGNVVGSDTALNLRGHYAEDVLEQLSNPDNPVTRVSESVDDWVETYAALVMQNWNGGLSEVTELEFLNAVSANMKSTGLSSAVAQVAGEETAELMMGPPLSYDIVVSRGADGSEASVSARYWRWQGTGWQEENSPTRRLEKKQSSVSLNAHTVGSQSDKGDYYVAPYPAFERTMEDNFVEEPVQ